MASYSMSNALVDKIHETNPDAIVGFLWIRSTSMDLDGKGNWKGEYVGGYENLLQNPFYTGFGGPYDITENSIKIGTDSADNAHMKMKIDRNLFYLAIGNIL